MELMQNIEDMLEESGFDYCEYSGCFDIAARRDSILLLKVLSNVDSFQEEQAKNLKILSRDLDAKSMLIGLHTRREALFDNIIYERFEIPTVSPKTLENILHRLLPEIYRFRGGLFADIDPRCLREARENAGLSQSELAKKVGITKKSIYEHESRKLKIVHKNAVKIERILKTKIITPLEINAAYSVEARPRSSFEGRISRSFRKIGFDTDSVYQSPFNMIAKDSKFMFLSDVEEKKRHLQRNVPYISEFSRITKKSAIIVTKEDVNFGIPSVREDELASLKPNDIRKLVKKW